MHNGFVTIENEKMSKSLNNIILVKDLTQKFHGDVIRLALLSSHYRQSLDWNEKIIHQTKKLIDKLYALKDKLAEVEPSNINYDDLSFLMDDLNTPGIISELNKIIKGFDEDNINNNSNLKSKLNLISSAIGILEDNEFYKIDENLKILIEDMIKQRSVAKENKDFKKADEIRDQIYELGATIEDTSEGTLWSMKK